MVRISRIFICIAAILAVQAGTSLADESRQGDGKQTASPASETPDEPAAITGWFRFDTDGLGTQLWAGAAHPWGGLTIASDIYVNGSVAELDLGVQLQPTPMLSITPMVGIAFDFETTDVAVLIAPLLFTIYSADKIYFESWIYGIWNSVFVDDGENLFYTRDFLLYNINQTIAAGVQVELTYQVNETGISERGVVSLPIGGRVNVAYGGNSMLGLFLGYETEAVGNVDGVAGRFTFIRTW